MFILKHGLKKQDSYDKCLFHTMCDSDAHFILQINLKIVVLTRRTLMMLIKPRNIIPLDLTHILTVFIMSHYFWLNVWVLVYTCYTKQVVVGLSLIAVTIIHTGY